MRMTPEKSKAKPTAPKPPDIVTLSIPDTLASLKVDPEKGLTNSAVEALRKAHGFNEVTEKKGIHFSCFSVSSGAYQRGCWN